MTIVIVGGGLAGAAAAALLAQAGRAPLLLERTRHAHDKICGEFLSTEAQAHLAALGLDLARLGGAPIDRVRMIDGRRMAAARLPFRALGLTRRRLDAALLDHAAAAGAQIDRGVTVGRIDGRRLATGAGTIDAGTILLASGKHDVRGVRRDTAGTLGHLIGFKQYYRVDAAARAALAGHIEIVRFGGGYAGLQLVEDGIANLCLLVDRARFDDAGGGGALLADLLAEPHLARRLGDATALLDRPLTIAGVPYGYLCGGTGDGVFRLGDQAGVIPSFAGDGMSIALHSATLAAQAVVAGATAAAYQSRLHRDIAPPVRRATRLQRGLATVVGRHALFAAIRLVPSALRWAAALTRVPEPALARAGVLQPAE